MEIVWENIQPDKHSQYAIKVGSHTYGVPYDGKSVMHYGSTYFAIVGAGPTMKSKVCILKSISSKT